MKSLRGMPASRTAITMISFSSWRTSETCVRRFRISASNMRGDSRSSMNSSAELLALAQGLRILGAELGDRAEHLVVESWRSSEARGRLERIRAGVDGFLLAVVRLVAFLFLVGFSSALRPPPAWSGFCGCAMTSGAFGSMKPTITSTRRAWPALTGS